MKKIIITYAVEKEFVDIKIDGWEITYVCTGIGKTKAAMKLTKALCEEKPDLVLNMGTAGTLRHKVGDIFLCDKFIDRDFQRVNLPGIEFNVSFDSMLSRLNGEFSLPTAKSGICNTGDSFVTEAASLDGDVVDMEAFALAIVCKEFDVPFTAVKYVTDIIGQNSVKHWEDRLADARKGLSDWLHQK